MKRMIQFTDLVEDDLFSDGPEHIFPWAHTVWIDPTKIYLIEEEILFSSRKPKITLRRIYLDTKNFKSSILVRETADVIDTLSSFLT